MEDIIKQLKKLQKIEADSRFIKQSRGLLVGTQKTRNVWGIILRNLELGASFALAGILIITILGGFSAWKFLSPLKLSNLDTTDLKAEAQAVDIQIQLTNLDYGEIAGVVISTTPSLDQKNEPAKIKNKVLAPETQNTATSTESDAFLSIEEALEKLAE